MSGLPGFYRAVVVGVADPERRRRVKLRIPSVFGMVTTGWAEPLFETLVPPVGTVVWAAFEAGDKDHPLYLAPQAVIAGGEEGQILSRREPAGLNEELYDGDYCLEWVDRNDHLHDSSAPEAYSPTNHSH